MTVGRLYILNLNIWFKNKINLILYVITRSYDGFIFYTKCMNLSSLEAEQNIKIKLITSNIQWKTIRTREILILQSVVPFNLIKINTSYVPR